VRVLITAAHVRDRRTIMVCSVQKCSWLCCNVGCHAWAQLGEGHGRRVPLTFSDGET